MKLSQRCRGGADINPSAAGRPTPQRPGRRSPAQLPGHLRRGPSSAAWSPEGLRPKGTLPPATPLQAALRCPHRVRLAGAPTPRHSTGSPEVQTRQDSPVKSGTQGSGAPRGRLPPASLSVRTSIPSRRPERLVKGPGVGKAQCKCLRRCRQPSRNHFQLVAVRDPRSRVTAPLISGIRVPAPSSPPLPVPGSPPFCQSEKQAISRCQVSLLDRSGTHLFEALSPRVVTFTRLLTLEPLSELSPC